MTKILTNKKQIHLTPLIAIDLKEREQLERAAEIHSKRLSDWLRDQFVKLNRRTA